MALDGKGTTRRGLLGALALGGCASVAEPPLRALYRQAPNAPEQPPLILIPGAFGSRLRNLVTNREIWPGGTGKLVFSRYPDLEVEIDPETLEAVPGRVVADGIFGDGAGRDYYHRLMRTLESAGGYRLRRPGEPVEPGQRNYYVYAYDWRTDLAAAIGGLDQLIERIRADYADPLLEVDIVAHSGGGLLARYYARYGSASVGDDCVPEANCVRARAIRRLVILGTPNLGTIQSALAHIRGEEVGLAAIAQEVVVTCMAVAQLFPHEDLDWLIDANGDVVVRDVFAIDTWREYGWSVFDARVRERVIARRGAAHLRLLERYFERSLARGRTFSRALAAPAPEDDVAPFVFGADCEPTLARVVVERARGHYVARERPRDVTAPRHGATRDVDYAARMFQPGDRVVTRQSLLGRCRSFDGVTCAGAPDLRIEHSVFLCEIHQSLTGNASFQNNLLYALLSA
jgi:pimeloyl-ACP methyl ester carboxylesterase